MCKHQRFGLVGMVTLMLYALPRVAAAEESIAPAEAPAVEASTTAEPPAKEEPPAEPPAKEPSPAPAAAPAAPAPVPMAPAAAAAPVPVVVSGQSSGSLAVEVQALSVLQDITRERNAERAAMLRSARRSRGSAIAVTVIGVLFQAAGATALGLGLTSGPTPLASLTAIGSTGFIEAAIGAPLSLIGLIMWPTGAAQWSRAQAQIDDLSRGTIRF